MCCWLSSLHVNLLSKSWKRSPCSVKSLGVKELISRGHWCHMPHQQILVSRSSKQPCCQHSRIFLSLSHIDDKLICVSLEMRNLLHFVLNNNEIGDAGGVLGLTVTLRQYSWVRVENFVISYGCILGTWNWWNMVSHMELGKCPRYCTTDTAKTESHFEYA